MGMFDSVYFNCPKCNANIEVQTKAGDSILSNYEANTVPAVIAEDIQGEEVYCPECGKLYCVIQIPRKATVPMGLLDLTGRWE